MKTMMEQLKEKLAIRDQLVDFELDALVAHHAMGMKSYGGKGRKCFSTDANALRKAVKEFCGNPRNSYIDKHRRIALLNDGFDEFKPFARCRAVNAWLTDPREVCLMMLDAIVEEGENRD